MSVHKPCQFERLQVLQEFLTKQEGRKGQDWAGCTQELKRQPSQKVPDRVERCHPQAPVCFTDFHGMPCAFA